ncbi:aminoglycoside phosphotransferase family protein [Luteimonas sp. RIT-PG2_3]|jgi:aminoglycoside/choline kinase family phosphotransferase
MDLSASDSQREQARDAWTRSVLGEEPFTLARASMDAGFRSYWRATTPARSLIVMDAPPDKEAVQPWLDVHALLASGGIRVPEVLAHDVERGFLLLEDLGNETYLHVIEAGNADDLFDAAFDQLLKLQSIAVPADFPEYDPDLLMRELRLFDEWFLGRHLGVQLDDASLARLQQAYRFLAEAALAQPQVLVHRDYMPRNLMPVSDCTAVIDFQDAVRGPIAYDVLTLFKDAFLSWPQADVDGWIARYHQRALDAGLPVPALARFRRDIDLIGVHRHLKVMGIFARLNHRDGKPKYVADAARFAGYLDAVVPRYPELAALDEILALHVHPALVDAAA